MGILAPSQCLRPCPPSHRHPGGGRLAGGPMQISATPISQISHLGRPTRLPPEGTPVDVAGIALCPDLRQPGPALPATFPATGPAFAPVGCRATPAFGYGFLAATPPSPISRWRLPLAVTCLSLGSPFASGRPYPFASGGPYTSSSSHWSVLGTPPSRPRVVGG